MTVSTLSFLLPAATAVTYLSEHGLTCKPMGADTECTYTMAASFVCTSIVDRKPQPPDYVVKSAHAIVEATPIGLPRR